MKHGGERANAGRKKKEPTTTVRVPSASSHLVKDMSRQIANSIREYVIQGLNKKGYYFNSMHEFFKFIESNCQIHDNKDLKVRTFYVENIPFLKNEYKTEKFEVEEIDGEICMSGNIGYFWFL